MVSVRKIELPVDGIGTLVAEASAEGFEFLDRLVEDWASGVHRFDGPYEGLLGVYAGEELVGVGALSVDPFVGRADTGRLRRIYVRQSWRRQGIGEGLVKDLLIEARKGFRVVRLRAENAHAAALYERLGFVAIEDANASHEMVLGGSVD